jgi:hypothetical protein
MRIKHDQMLGVAAGQWFCASATSSTPARGSILSGGTDKGGEGQQRRVVAYELWRSRL